MIYFFGYINSLLLQSFSCIWKDSTCVKLQGINLTTCEELNELHYAVTYILSAHLICNTWCNCVSFFFISFFFLLLFPFFLSFFFSYSHNVNQNFLLQNLEAYLLELRPILWSVFWSVFLSFKRLYCVFLSLFYLLHPVALKTKRDCLCNNILTSQQFTRLNGFKKFVPYNAV